MKQTVIINGFETEIEVPVSQLLSQVTYTGSVDNFKIHYGNGLVKVGGTITINTKPVTGKEFTEGVQIVTTGLNQVLSVGCIALDNSTGSMREHSHIGQVHSGQMNVYASSMGTEDKAIKVHWFAEGVE